jgi:DNA polymerase III subunit delta'
MSGATHPTVSRAVDGHPHARAILLGALAGGSAPSHAYLFHGPSGSGKRTAARAFAAALLAEGTGEEESVRARVWRDAHPDLTWVAPSGASELLVSDIAERVVGAVAHTPLESARRVFVIEAAGTMNDQAANRMLKTLEEPPPFAHLILLAEHADDVLATIASRCQRVRFDPPSSATVHERLLAESAGAAGGLAPERALACARLAGGDGRLAERLACEEGERLRGASEAFVRAAIDGRRGERPWVALVEGAREAGARAGERAAERIASDAELLPSKERRRHEREGVEVARRAERRERTAALDLGLRLAELWLRDAWCMAIGAPELAFAVDRPAEIAGDAEGREPAKLLAGVELVCDTRLRLALNVSEELALEALAHRLSALLAREVD